MTKTNRRKRPPQHWHSNASALGFCAAVFAAGCAGKAAGPRQEESVDDTAAALTQGTAGTAAAMDQQQTAGTTAATDQQEITIASLPDSTCTLTDDKSGNSTQILADDEGLVHLWAAPTAASKTLTLDCDEANGSGGSLRAHYNFDLAETKTFATAVPRATSKRRRVLPGLADPNGISQSAVTAAGYPPRPDTGSPRYESWRRLVATPVTLIDANTIETELHRGPATSATSQNWSGLILDYPGSAPYTKYTDVGSTYTILPFYQQGTGTSIASPWVGLGGSTDNAIIQEGLDGVSVGGVTTYKPWVEYFPNSLIYPAFAVSLGDVVYWEVWECDSSRNYGPTRTGYGCFYWADLTKGTSYIKTIKKPTSATFLGGSCEAIVERVTDCGSYCRLSSWTGVVWQQFQCWDQGGTTTRDLTTEPYLVMTMTNASGQNMVVPSSANPNWAGFDWIRSN